MARTQVLGAICGALGLVDLALLNFWLVPRAWPERLELVATREPGASHEPVSRRAPVKPPPPPVASSGPAAPAAATAPTTRPIASTRPDGVRLVVRFGSSTSSIASTEEEAVRAFAHALRKQRRVWITVEGHTDQRGDTDLNQRLSWLRAQAVTAILIEEGIPAGWISARGLGSSRPLDSSDTTPAWASNRRAEIRATTKPEVQQ